MFKKFAIMILLLGTGCTTQTLVNTDKPYTMQLPIAEGVATKGVWAAADFRVLLFDGAEELPFHVQWQKTPVGQHKPAGFALLSPQQVHELNQEADFRYAGGSDPTGFFLKRAREAVANSAPAFLMKTDDEHMLDIQIAADVDAKGQTLYVVVAAAEVDPADNLRPKRWIGSATIPLRDKVALIDIPAVAEDPAGITSHAMLMVAPQTFNWQNGRYVISLPWGRTRVTTIEGRNISTAWYSPKNR